MASNLSSASSILSRKVLPTEQAQSLLKKKIELQMFISSKEVISVATDVEQVYIACKKTLESHYGPVELAIRGSSVAGLFSNEKAGDLDLQAKFSFQHLKDKAAIIREGYSLRWKLLESLRELFLQQVPQEKHAMIRSFSLDAFHFRDTNVLSAHLDQGPCNIHQLQVGEIEISCFIEIDPSKPPQRNFDFNSGALEIILNDQGQVVLQTPLENLEETIKEITSKELSCVRPHEISRRALSRYFNKLVFSGYVDPSPDLLTALIETSKVQLKKDAPQEIAEELVKELQLVFKEKKSPLWLLYLALWISQDQHPVIQEVVKNIKPLLSNLLEKEIGPITGRFKTWIDTDSRESIAWLLMLQASSLEVKIHRGQPHLHVQIQHPYPSNFLLPLETFSQAFNANELEIFFKETSRVVLEKELSRETKEFLQKVISKQAKNSAFFPAFYSLSKKFSFKTQPASAAMFCSWFSELSAATKDSIPFEIVESLLPFIQEDRLSSDSICALLKIIQRHLITENLSLFDPSLNPAFTIACCNRLIRSHEISQLSKEDQQEIFNLIKKLQKDYFALEKLEKSFLKSILNFSLLLQKNDLNGFENLASIADVCYRNGFFDECFKLWNFILVKGPKQHHEVVLKNLAYWSKLHPDRFLTFFQKYQDDLKNVEGFCEACFLQNHFNLAEQLEHSQFVKYCDLLEKMQHHSLLLDLAKASKDNIFKASSNALYFLQFVVEKMQVSIFDILDFQDMQLNAFQQALQLPLVEKALKEKKICKQEVFKAALRLKQEKIAKQLLENLIQESPSQALELLANSEYLQSFSLTDALTYANSLVATFSFEEDHNIRQLTHHALDLLGSRCDVLFKEKSSLNERQLIQTFHKKFMLHTIEHPTWPKVWSTIIPELKDKQFQSWIAPEMFMERLEQVCLTQMYPLFSQLEVSMGFIEKYAERVFHIFQKTSPSERNDLIEMLFNFSERTNGAFWDLDLRSYRHNEFAMKQFQYYFSYFLRLDPKDVKNKNHMELLLLSLRGMSLFASSEKRKNEILSLFAEMMENPAADHPEFFQRNGRYQLFLLSLMQKALQEKDLDQSFQVYLLYRNYCSPDITQKSLVKQEDSLADLNGSAIDALCKETIRMIDNNFFSSDFSLEFKPNIQEFAVINFYNTFLSDMLLTFEEAISAVESSKKPQILAKRQKVLGYIKDQIERTARMANLENFASLKHLSKYKRLFSKEIKQELAKKLFKVTTDLMQRKKTLSSGDDARIIIFMINQIQEFFDPEDFIEEQLTKEITEFLENIRPLLFIQSPYSFVDQKLVHFIRSLETCLPKENLEEYIVTWARSAVKRKESVGLQELNCLSILTLRLDARFNKIFAKDPLMEKLNKKVINFDKFFKDREKIELFIRLFDIAFRRFGAGLPKSQLYEFEDSLNIFSLFVIMNSHLRKAIPFLKLEKDKINMLSLFLDTLLPQLIEQSNFMTKSVVASSWNSLFMTEKNPRARERFGKPRFRFLEKENMKRNCIAFYHLTKKVEELPEEYRANMGLDGKALLDVFSIYEEALKSHLSKNQMQHLHAIFSKEKASLAAGRAADERAAASAADSSQTPDLLKQASGFFSGLLDFLPSISSRDSSAVANPEAVAAAAVNLLAEGMDMLVLDSDDEAQ